ncbi:hypothetical protein [Dactylosporangium sp. NPDC050588]|uniref:hypothetical protein n=1 Tax=Dactylosporangium sp. NPDC050588 TaxID=3157211 RepID=UPI0033DD4C2E
MRALLATHWGLTGAEVVDHHGGMNSRTWFVTAGGTRYVAKSAAGDWFPGGVPVPLRYRHAVQADYFARRIAGDDLTGIADPAENEQGLEDARRALRA